MVEKDKRNCKEINNCYFNATKLRKKFLLYSPVCLKKDLFNCYHGFIFFSFPCFATQEMLILQAIFLFECERLML